ncbi:MAG TPA: hypothetical protein VFE49_04390 [Jiangellaceae bacterium]|jgi:hypothetical protein|nr:hypothetical protein [Jiangellaceae bacterium]
MRIGFVLTLAVLLATAGCGDETGDGTVVPATEPPSTDPIVVGVITHVEPFEPVTRDCVDADPRADPDTPVSSDDPPVCSDPDTPLLGTVLVEEDPGSASGDTKVSFAIETGTALLERRGETYEPVSFADLVVGTTASAWAVGAIMESYPAQATASVIVVEDGGRP